MVRTNCLEKESENIQAGKSLIYLSNSISSLTMWKLRSRKGECLAKGHPVCQCQEGDYISCLYSSQKTHHSSARVKKDKGHSLSNVV